MRLGIDFDNTLVRYDHVIYETALEKQLIPDTLPANKTQIRNFIRRHQGPDVWTALQGLIYGKLIEQAHPSEGALDSLRYCKQAGVSLVLISHKTEWPVLGPRWNLRDAARAWLRINGLYEPDSSDNLLDEIWFEETRDAKLNRIALQRCDAFVDDLPDFLADTTFPGNAVPILFDPNLDCAVHDVARLRSWGELPILLKTLELI